MRLHGKWFRRGARGYAVQAAVSLALGLAAGLVCALAADGTAVVFAAGRLTLYLQSSPQGGAAAFPEAFVKHLRTGAAVWLLGFVPRVPWLGYVLCAGKAAAFGLAVGLFGRAFGIWGVQKALALTGLQQLLLLSVTGCAAAGCRLFAARELPGKAYALLGAGMAATAGIAAAMDVFLWRALI